MIKISLNAQPSGFGFRFALYNIISSMLKGITLCWEVRRGRKILILRKIRRGRKI